MRFPLAAEAYWVLVVATVRRRRFTMLALPAILRSPPSADGGNHNEGDLIMAAQRALRLAERTVPVRLSCLQRTVALYWLLSRRGIAVEPRIGVRNVAADLEAHAWLEFRGRILNSSATHCRQYHVLRPATSTATEPAS